MRFSSVRVKMCLSVSLFSILTLIYVLQAGGQKYPVPEMDPKADAPEDALAFLDEPCLFLGSGADLYRGLITEKMGARAVFAPRYQNLIRASTVGFLAMEKFAKGGGDTPAVLVPQYIRKSDAELNLGKT